MGFLDNIFGGDKKVQVASVAYNLAGDEELRPQYLQTLVLQNILSHTKNTITDTIRVGYLRGPGIRFRSFFRWANDNYDLVGMPSGYLDVSASIDLAVVEPYIPVGAGQSVWIQDGEIDGADYGRWVEQWLLKYYPAQLEKNWTADIDEDTGDITIIFQSGAEHTFTPVDFHARQEYLYVYYTLLNDEVLGDFDAGSDISFTTTPPDTTGWTLDDTVTTPTSINLYETVETEVTYSDATPDEYSSVPTLIDTEYYDRIVYTYIKETYLGSDDPTEDLIRKKTETMYITYDKTTEDTVVVDGPTDEDIGGGVTKTTTITTTTESVIDNNKYKIDTQYSVLKEWESVQLFIYRIGTGDIPDIDDAVSETHSYGKFFPFLPIRLKGEFLSDSFKPSVYELVDDAFKKATGANVDELIEKIEDNDDIDDIDYGYVVFGVALNTTEKACKRYLWNFFIKLMDEQAGGPSAYTDWLIEREGAQTAAEAWEIWREAQNHPSDPLFGTPEPSIASTRSVTLGNNQIRIKNTGDVDTDYDVRLRWTYITTGAGAGRYDGMANDGYRFEFVGEDEFASTIVGGTTTIDPLTGLPVTISKADAKIEKIRLYHQINETDGYEYLDIVGLVHRNIIYKGKEIKTSAKKGLRGQDEETGFIIPLHFETFHDMRLVDSTQMTTSCIFIVFNCYEVVKIPWYASGFFKFLLVVVIAIAAALLTGGVGIGILGTNVAVGTSMGFSGTVAAIVGSVANSLAAVALATVLTYGAQKLFGQTIGTIVGVLTSLITIQALTSFSASGSLSGIWGELMSVDNLLKITDALSQGYAAFTQENIEEMAVKAQEYIDQASKKIEDIEGKIYDQFGAGTAVIDPLKLMEAKNLIVESSDTFLRRTLMTGTDIADMSNNMLSDFASLTLELPDPYT